MTPTHEHERDRERSAEFARRLRGAQDRLFSFIHSLVRNFSDTEDLFQQVSLVLWRKFDEFDPGRSFLGWACGVARFEASNFLRTRGRSRLYFTDELNLLLAEAQEDGLPTDPDDESRRRALGECVTRLRQPDRELVDLCYSEDASGVSDVAGRLGRSSQSVHNSLRRIRRALYECVRRALSQRPMPEATL